VHWVALYVAFTMFSETIEKLLHVTFCGFFFFVIEKLLLLL
jgi:hypothetical protein